MKRLFCLISMLILITGTSCVNADIGMPEKPMYTVAIGLDGANYYDNFYELDNPIGRLNPGQIFYVWHDSDEVYIGTVKPAKAKFEPDGEMITVKKSDTLSSSTVISGSDVGSKLEKPLKAELTGDDVNLRCGPGTGFNVLDSLAIGTKLEYQYTYTSDMNWCYVNIDGVNGWVCKDYVQDSAVQDDPDEESDAEEPIPASSNNVLIIVLCCLAAAIITGIVVYLVLKKKYDRKEEN